jgi:hypothetical protein
VVPEIRDKLYNVIPGALPALLEFAATPDLPFINEWRKRFVEASDRHAPVMPDGIPGRPPQPRLREVGGLTFFRVAEPETRAGFWASATPIAGSLATRIRERLAPEHRPVPLPDGHLGWDAPAAAAIAEMLRPLGVTLPDPACASALRCIFALGPDECARRGWRSPVENFWCQNDAGAIVSSAGGSAHLPVVFLCQQD